MKSRIEWVPSLLTGELVPKRRSVWDTDEEEESKDARTNQYRQLTLMESTPYTRPENYRENRIVSVESAGDSKTEDKKARQAPASGNIWSSGPITEPPSFIAPFSKMIENNSKGIYQPQHVKPVQPPSDKFVLPVTDPNAPRDSISDSRFLDIIKPYLDPNQIGLSADSLRTISRSDKDIEYGTAIHRYNPSGRITSSELKADYITHGKPAYEKDGFLYHSWDGDLSHKPGAETTGYLHTHPGPHFSSPSPGDMKAFAILQKDRVNTDDALMAAFTPNAEYYVTIEDQEKMKGAIRKGAFDYVEKDFHTDQILKIGLEFCLSGFVQKI